MPKADHTPVTPVHCVNSPVVKVGLYSTQSDKREDCSWETETEREQLTCASLQSHPGHKNYPTPGSSAGKLSSAQRKILHHENKLKVLTATDRCSSGRTPASEGSQSWHTLTAGHWLESEARVMDLQQSLHQTEGETGGTT